MTGENSGIKPAACSQYEALLKKSHIALKQWKEGRAEIWRSGRIGHAADNELRILQANFAKAYTALQNHTENCERCHMPSVIHGYEANSAAVSHEMHP
jgi:hypothetical protein